MTLSEELRALAEDFSVSGEDSAASLAVMTIGMRSALLALATRAEREHSPEREAFVEAAQEYFAKRSWARQYIGLSPEELDAVQALGKKALRAYRAMLATEEKRNGKT